MNRGMIALCLLVASGSFAQDRLELDDPLKDSFRAEQTTLADQTDVAVTVYNNNLALVRDRRQVSLFPGEIALKFMDVAQQIMPETVSLQSISAPGAIRILEQNYEFDLMSPQKMLEKYVGKEVRLVNFSNQVGFEEKTAKLLSVNQGAVYEVDGEIFLGHPGNVALPEIPENLIAKPTLVWLLDNGESDQELEATYLTRGISWKADYVITMAKDEKHANIDAWVTLNNQAGTAFENAKLKLVAGDVNMVRQAAPQAMVMMESRAMGAAAPMVEESFAEYHLYTLPRRTTIKQNQSKQVSLFNAAGIAMTKRYEYRGQIHFYSQRLTRFEPQNVEVFMEFENEASNQLGVPLPGGVMRIYQQDSEGMLQFAGEDRIKHTPKDETVTLRMGTAFDIVAERVQTDFERVSDRVYECAFEISVRNHKEIPVRVDVVEPMPADWTIRSQSHAHDKRDAHTAVFSLDVEPDGDTVLTYEVRVRY